MIEGEAGEMVKAASELSHAWNRFIFYATKPAPKMLRKSLRLMLFARTLYSWDTKSSTGGAEGE